MSLALSASTLYKDADHGITIVRVQSMKCHYRVGIKDDCLTIYGPGVEEEYPLDSLGPSTLSAEAYALIAVTIFEEE